jgi:hypothetical protein
MLSSSLLSKNLKIKICRNIIFLVPFYGCETKSFTLKKERRLRAFENRVLRRIFGTKGDEVTGKWKKIHKDLYDLPNTIWVIKLRRMG